MPRGSAESVESCMVRDLEVVRMDASAVIAASRMAARKIGCVLIQAEDHSPERPRMVGLVSETDLVRKVMARGLPPSSTTVAQIMASPLLTITPDRSMLDASHFMEKHAIRHLCVLQGGKVGGKIVGLISIRDLVKHFVNEESGPIRDLDDVYRPLSVLMRRKIEKIDREDSLLTAATHMANQRIGALLVTQAGAVAGIVTERDLVQKAMAQNQDPGQVRVGSLMTQSIIDIDINRTVHDASDLMAKKGIRHLPVTENHTIVGILSVRDLIKMISVRDRPRFLRQQ